MNNSNYILEIRSFRRSVYFENKKVIIHTNSQYRICRVGGNTGGSHTITIVTVLQVHPLSSDVVHFLRGELVLVRENIVLGLLALYCVTKG